MRQLWITLPRAETEYFVQLGGEQRRDVNFPDDWKPALKRFDRNQTRVELEGYGVSANTSLTRAGPNECKGEEPAVGG